MGLLEKNLLSIHLQEMGVPLCLDVGGAFDVATGLTQLAPKWIRMAGLEWFYRVIQEPGRFWKRYTIRQLDQFTLAG